MPHTQKIQTLYRPLSLFGAALSLCALQAEAASPYISEVFDFSPAPGQFVNVVPTAPEGATRADMIRLAGEQLVGDARPGMVSLGAFGGYVVFGFDHPLVNVPGEYDVRIYGNATISSSEPYGGSCEPGVVWVSMDTNRNGLPDDEWYQLAGSEYSNPATIHNVTVTYHRPDAAHTPVPHPTDRAVTDAEYIRWTTDSELRPEGFLQHNTFHPQGYWPEWISDDTITLTGTLLPDNAIDTKGNGTSWLLTAFGEGYVDNFPFRDDKGLKLDLAVNAKGEYVNLPAVDFIKVQTGLLQTCGWIGETSTEVCGAEDLHPDAVADYTTVAPIVSDAHNVTLKARHALLTVTADSPTLVNVYAADGTCIFSGEATAGESELHIPAMHDGIFILHAGSTTLKVRL